MIPQDDIRGSATKPLNDPKEIEAFLSSNTFILFKFSQMSLRNIQTKLRLKMAFSTMMAVNLLTKISFT